MTGTSSSFDSFLTYPFYLLLQIDVIDTVAPSFFLNASLELSLPTKDDPFLSIGKELTADNSGVEGGK